MEFKTCDICDGRFKNIRSHRAMAHNLSRSKLVAFDFLVGWSEIDDGRLEIDLPFRKPLTVSTTMEVVSSETSTLRATFMRKKREGRHWVYELYDIK